MLRFMDKSIVCSPRYQRYVLDLAEEKGLAVQSSVREGGGNNGAIINTSLDGIPVIVVGVPVRYIHSHYGITSYYDSTVSNRSCSLYDRGNHPFLLIKFLTCIKLMGPALKPTPLAYFFGFNIYCFLFQISTFHWAYCMTSEKSHNALAVLWCSRLPVFAALF